MFCCPSASDYGFVHQVLSYERIHQVRATATSQRLNAYLSSKIGDLNTYGSYYLSAQELNACIENLLEQYYSYLASNALTFRGRRIPGVPLREDSGTSATR